MNTKYIIIVLGEPFSIFSEIIGKSYKVTKNIKSKIIVVGNINLFQKQLMKLKYKIKLNQINKLEKAKKNIINIINIDFKFTKIFSKISNKSNSYIEKSFSKSLDIIKKSNYKCAMINGPISKKTFLKKKYFGITEYLSNKTNTNEEVMLIYNNKLSVSPLTTHIPLKKVSKNITKNKIINNVKKLEKFYNQTLKIKPRFAILGLNPHCETTDDFSEEDKIIKPAIRKLKLKK